MRVPKTAPAMSPETYDEHLIDPADRLLLAALRGNTFRLAVQCDTCGSWLVAPASVRRHRGPRCSAKVAAKVAGR